MPVRPQRGNGGVPIALGSLQSRRSDGFQNLEAIVHRLVPRFDPPGAFHVGLPEAEEDVEIRVRGGGGGF